MHFFQIILLLYNTFLKHTATIKKDKKSHGTGTPSQTGEEENDDVDNKTPTTKEKSWKAVEAMKKSKRGNILNFPERYTYTSMNYLKLMYFVFTILY
jgi:hypothetical protein